MLVFVIVCEEQNPDQFGFKSPGHLCDIVSRKWSGHVRDVTS